MQTASISGSASSASTEGATRAMLNASAMRWLLSTERLQTATISTSPASRRPGMWREAVFAPAPMSPMRMAMERLRRTTWPGQEDRAPEPGLRASGSDEDERVHRLAAQ